MAIKYFRQFRVKFSYNVNISLSLERMNILYDESFKKDQDLHPSLYAVFHTGCHIHILSPIRVAIANNKRDDPVEAAHF